MWTDIYKRNVEKKIYQRITERNSNVVNRQLHKWTKDSMWLGHVIGRQKRGSSRVEICSREKTLVRAMYPGGGWRSWKKTSTKWDRRNGNNYFGRNGGRSIATAAKYGLAETSARYSPPRE